MAPLLANLLSITDDLPPDLAMLDPVVRKQQMLAMLAEMLSELSRQPVLLLIEDAHWIDPSTHDLFRQIARAVNDSAILMLVNLRPGGRPCGAAIRTQRAGSSAVSTVARPCCSSKRLPAARRSRRR